LGHYHHHLFYDQEKKMALQQWAAPQISKFLSIDEDASKQIVTYTETLSDAETAQHLQNLLGDSPSALEFIASFNTIKAIPGTTSGQAQSTTNGISNGHDEKAHNNSAPTYAPPPAAPPVSAAPAPRAAPNYPPDILAAMNTGNLLNPPSTQQYAPPPGPPPSNGRSQGPAAAQGFAPPPGAPPSSQVKAALRRPPHTNAVIEAGLLRAKDEQEMQNLLQTVQMKFGIYNSDIEPEHDTDYYCNCMIHMYQRRKWARIPVQDKWSKAVMYPGEKSYNDDYRMTMLFSNNPYRYGVMSPYGNGGSQFFQQSPRPRYHAISVQQTIQLNAKLNKEAQRNIDAREPKASIWEIEEYPQDKKGDYPQDKKGFSEEKSSASQYPDEKNGAPPPSYPDEKTANGFPEEKKKRGLFGSSTKAPVETSAPATKPKKLNGLFRAMGVASAEEKAAAKAGKAVKQSMDLKSLILTEEDGRWPDEAWRNIVTVYQEKIGMRKKVADLRARQPIQYLHLLRAGYFEPIPVAWANLASNPLKFSIEASAGWRGITPAWRGFEDTAEERLYWVLNHREGVAGIRLKPDFISEMNMARARMDSAVEPPPEYFSPDDTCHLQHTSEGYSRQVMPSPFRPTDRPEVPTDDTMILLDVSGSMDFDPVRPVYDQYMITSYVRSTQPKNKGENMSLRNRGKTSILTILNSCGQSGRQEVHRCNG
jgi:hypothetical protein